MIWRQVLELPQLIVQAGSSRFMFTIGIRDPAEEACSDCSEFGSHMHQVAPARPFSQQTPDFVPGDVPPMI